MSNKGKQEDRTARIRAQISGLTDDELVEIGNKAQRYVDSEEKPPGGFSLAHAAQFELVRRRNNGQLSEDSYASVANSYCPDYKPGESFDPTRGICYNCELLTQPACPYEGSDPPFLEVMVTRSK